MSGTVVAAAAAAAPAMSAADLAAAVAAAVGSAARAGLEALAFAFARCQMPALSPKLDLDRVVSDRGVDGEEPRDERDLDLGVSIL